MQETEKLLRSIRRFMEPRWMKIHEARRELDARLLAFSGERRNPYAVPDRLSTGMGMISAAVASEAARRILGQRWIIAGGIDDPESGRTGGFAIEDGSWTEHYWCIHKGSLFDVSCDQFGGPKVLVSSENDKRYKRNLKPTEIKVCTKEACKKAVRIVDEFMSLQKETMS